MSGRCRKDLGESDVKCSKITESILKSFNTDHPDAAEKPYGFALLGQLAPSVPMRAAERERSTGRRMVTISITEEAYEAIKATVRGRRAMMCGRPRSTSAPSCAFWFDRATIDRLTALKIILLGPDLEARSAVLTLGSGGLLNARGWGAGTEEVRGSNPLSSTKKRAQIDVISYSAE